MNVSNVNTQKVNDVGNLCQDPDTSGFDLQAGQSWIYPTNYSVRDYQYNIIEQALHKNTLVSLPTGLGKTFIAAVVMYNFYRWYPHGKVIFMAPTRPLVKQQMDACYNITAIPKEVTAELTGTKVQQSRGEIWQNKRVFFITPQVLQNDLAIIIELASKIKVLVFDEAHRAKGNHAYCEVVRKLLPKNKLFRVLALSATPGNSSKDVIDVMQNLLIAHVEFRSEDSPDVKPYVFERALETVVVPLGEKLQQIKDRYVQILERYTRTLMKYKVIYGNCCNLTKGRIFMVMKEFQARNAGNRNPNYAEIMKSLNICITLYHAYETLIRCGLRAFLNFYEEHMNNPLLNGNVDLRRILEDLREYLGPDAAVQPLPDGTFTEIPSSTKFGHPKFYKLEDILVTHFNNSEASTRVIVFFEYRESASEAYALLSRSYPLIKSRVFVGQGSGVTQKDQINTIKAFREGTCNTLLSTCIGEEGLDVGDVDLIVCFDIANKSPIRMIQRMGRTGRKKEGRVVVLVTEGKEQQTLKDCLIYKNNLGNFVSNSGQLEDGKYGDNPKMIPSYIQPKCQKMFITVKPQVSGKSGNLRDMLKRITSSGPIFSDDLEIVEIQERIKTKNESFWDKESPLEFEFEPPKINFSKHLEKQRSFQDSGTIKHSKQTEIFVSLLQFADSKRYNLPVTQQISKFSDFNQDRVLKQGDIRSMFAKPAPISLTQETYLPISQHHIFDKEKDTSRSFPQQLFDEISTYLSIEISSTQNCKTCDLLFECPKIDCTESAKIDLSSWTVPDVSILDSITAKDLEVFAESLTPKSKEIYKDFLEVDNEAFDEVTFSEFDDAHSSTMDIKEKSLAYETPRNFDKILKSFQVNEDPDEPLTKTAEEKSFAYETPKNFGKVLSILGNSLVEEFADEAPFPQTIKTTTSRNLETIQEEFETVTNQSQDLATRYKQTLIFFKLSSMEEIFAADLDETVIYTPQCVEQSPKKSPDIFDESPDLFPSSEKEQDDSVCEEAPGSPILCSYERVQILKAKKKLFDSKVEEVAKKPKLSNLKLKRKSFYESTRNKVAESRSFLDVSDVCDLSDFISSGQTDLERSSEDQRKNNPESSKKEEIDDLDIRDLCDLSVFGLTTPASQANQKNNKFESTVQEERVSKLVENSPGVGFEVAGPSKNEKRKELTIDDLCDISDFFGEPSDQNNTQKRKDEKKEETSKTTKLSDLEDFCDFSSFLGTPQKDTVVDLTQTPGVKADSQNRDRKTPKNEKNLKTNVIDLTDSDFESSPAKVEPTQTANKTLSQLSITQMLSLVEKNTAPLSHSQKENATQRTKKPQKSGVNLSTKKNILQLKQNLDSPKPSQKKTNTQNTPKKKTTIFNIPLAGDSDDEFEDSCKSPIFAKPKPVAVSSHKNKPENPIIRRPKKRKKLFSDFIETEAEVSEDERVDISADEDSGEDCFEASFVADDTQDCLNTTNMHARYLQSVKSPRRGVFKIPQKFKHNISNVFSQEVNNEDNTYLNDSFCVEETEEVEAGKHDVSELELLEKKLKEMKRSRKRKKSNEKEKVKRRRIMVLEDDSD
ncbi:hypothetical protein Zmor_020244 [Zophobas morio]|uniref:Fanconi anemia group M protein n=1 Tax=Zophobas morio TaxID=2755281 RepID=A0AA38M9A1_9CUCU|nr:hypothetical protein Zmor_020244 [Zophobas morio]